MPSKECNPEKSERSYSAFLPMLLLASALIALVGFQASQQIRERQQLEFVRTNQQQPLIESRNVRAQLESITTGLAKLAEDGNQNAVKLRARLNELGLNTR